MAYKRQISYLDLIENGIKRGNAGFIKWEKYDECHILSVFINGAEGMFSKEANVMLWDGHSIGKIKITNGKAEGTYLLARDEKDWVEEIDAVRIVIGQGKELIAEFEKADFASVQNVQEPTDEPVEEERRDKEENFPKESTNREEELEIPAFFIEEKPPEVQEQSKEQKLPEEQELPSEQEAAEPQEELPFWERMQQTHEMIYPFGNNVGCYRIFPKDIHMLHSNYHVLENNQFLMHGYYNYRHLIIFLKKDKENEYWLGVPGIYHEREKMAARMFGFEKFEGTKPEYRTGDMGYYLITVE